MFLGLWKHNSNGKESIVIACYLCKTRIVLYASRNEQSFAHTQNLCTVIPNVHMWCSQLSLCSPEIHQADAVSKLKRKARNDHQLLTARLKGVQ